MEITCFRQYVTAAIITVVCVVFLFLPTHAFTRDISWNNVLYHFSHANIFHLAANLIALWQLRPRWSTTFVAFAVATLVSMIPAASLDLPTCGLSAFLFAAYSRRYVAWHNSFVKLLMFQLVLSFIPCLNWRVHLLSFLIAYVFWYVFYNHYRYKHRK